MPKKKAAMKKAVRKSPGLLGKAARGFMNRNSRIEAAINAGRGRKRK